MLCVLSQKDPAQIGRISTEINTTSHRYHARRGTRHGGRQPARRVDFPCCRSMWLITRACASWFRMAMRTSVPFDPGSRWSINTRSGQRRRYSRKASPAVEAWATTAMSNCDARTNAEPSRKAGIILYCHGFDLFSSCHFAHVCPRSDLQT